MTPDRPAPAPPRRDEPSTHSSVWVERPVGTGVPPVAGDYGGTPTKTPAALPF